MMFEIAVGDAYGACFEGADRGFVNRNNDLHYETHPRKLRKRPEDYNPSLVPKGGYTDDTQMSIAVAEAMLEDGPWEEESLADRFVEAFRRDPRRGYTPYFLNVLMNSESGKVMMSKIDGKSFKSGGVMRAGPCGLYPDLGMAMEVAALQSMVTHDSWVGRNTAAGLAMMVHYFWYDLGPKDQLVEWMNDAHFGGLIHREENFKVNDGMVVEAWYPEQQRRVRVHGWDVLEAAIFAIERTDNLADLLVECVSYTGDVDTVAAVACAAASCSKEIEQDLPASLTDKLENGEFGADFLRVLDQKLEQKYPRVRHEIPDDLFDDAGLYDASGSRIDSDS